MDNSAAMSAIITAHNEGILAGVSLSSFLECVASARERGLAIEVLAVLDHPNFATRSIFDQFRDAELSVLEVNYKDQGLSRNWAVQNARGRYVAFLDADDLWSHNWLERAFDVCESRPQEVIAHPEFNWFFEGDNSILIKADQESEVFDLEFLRFGNYWDALCLAPRDAYLSCPFPKRDLATGYAYEDWLWNCETISKGYVHKIVTDTIHFKRRREKSQNILASQSKSMMRPSSINSFSYYKSS